MSTVKAWKHVLVLGAAGPAGYNVCLSLLRAGAHVTGQDSNAYHRALLERSLTSYDGKPQQDGRIGGCVERLSAAMGHATQGDYDLVIAQPDVLVRELAISRKVVPTILPPEGQLRTCGDKMLTADALPDNIRPQWATQLRSDAEAWCRLRQGAGSQGAFRGTRENCYAYIRAFDEQHRGHEWMVQEYLPGPEFACQLVYWKGLPHAYQSRERVEYDNPNVFTGQSSSPSVQRIPDRATADEVSFVAEQAVEATLTGRELAHGVYGVDMRRDNNGDLRVTEVNAGRFYTTTMFLTTNGLNLPGILVDLGNSTTVLPEKHFNPLKAGTTWVRQIDMGTTTMSPYAAAAAATTYLQWSEMDSLTTPSLSPDSSTSESELDE